MESRGSEARGRWALFALLALGLGALWVGWREFWFLTDDAYITFRYISNRHLGLGYVWNPPPFRPVEGYSNFLWMVLLDVIWTVARVEPPSAANVVSLVCAGVILWRVWRWSSGGTSPVWRTALALLFLLSNRTFLTWASSGLETALFNLFLLLWFEQAWHLSPSPRGPSAPLGTGSAGWGEGKLGTRDFTLLATWAVLATLTRPDGLLAWGATIVLAALPTRSVDPRRRAWLLVTGFVLALVPLHFLWRRFTYGEWLPNTYYAKHVAPWPEAGLRYLGCFIVEYGSWMLGVLALIVLLRRVTRAALARLGWFRLAAVGTLVAHTGYYVLRVGGDHFEYRMLSQWVPLLAVGWAFVLVEVKRPGLRALALGLSLAAAWPIQWAHWLGSRELTTRNQTWKLKVAVAPRLGPVFSPLTSWFDAEQDWLIEHHVCMRHQEHKVFGEEQRRVYPVRQALGASGEDVPVVALTTVGVPGWQYPDVAVIDLFGLNDYVVARTPVSETHFRLMAHDRAAPWGYVDCFRPNVALGPAGAVRALPRTPPLTSADITGCERDFLAIVRGEQAALPSLAEAPAMAPAQPLSPTGFDGLAQAAEVLARADFSAPPPGMEVRGLAFGEGPETRALPGQQAVSGASGGFLNSFHRGDLATGMVRFPLPRGTRRVAFKVGGSADCRTVFAGVVSGDRVLAKACGRQSETLEPVLLSVESQDDLHFVVFDGSSEGWGHVIVDDVVALGAPVEPAPAP